MHIYCATDCDSGALSTFVLYCVRTQPVCRLIMAYKQQKWFEPPVEDITKIMKTDLEGYPFRQLPRLIDTYDHEGHTGDIDIVESMVCATTCAPSNSPVFVH